MDTTQALQSLLLMLCKTTSQHPMSDGEIASLKNIKLAEANAMLDKLYEAKAISSVKSIKDGKEQRLVWVTGLPYRPAPTMPKEVAWQHLRTQAEQTPMPKPSQKATMDSQPKHILIVPTNINEAGIKTPQKIVRFLFANTKATINEIKMHCNIQFVDQFIKAYVRKGYIERTKENNLAVYAISPKGRLLGNADALYNQARVKHPSQLKKHEQKINQTVEAKEKSEQPLLTTLMLDAFKPDQENNAQPANSIETERTSIEKTDIEFKLEKTQGIRFALTDEGTLMILGVQYAPIELSKEDTRRLYDFAENTAHAI